MADFLLEIGLEEVPARMLASAEAELAKRVADLLRRHGLTGEDAMVQSFSTPRRLAVLVSSVALQQPDTVEELLGPPVKAAFKDGVPTAAAHAFAAKAGVPVQALTTVTNARGEYLSARLQRRGADAASVIAAELPKEIAAIYWAKNMYWRAGKPERFVRPVQWLVALLDGDVVPLEWAGRKADRLTYGHRVLHGSAPIALQHPREYRERLLEAKVMPLVEERRHVIRKDLDRVTRSVPSARWREDEALVDKVTHMTEWPSVLLGRFEDEYLALPQEVLVTVLRDHQNDFAVEGANATLLPYFLAVLNTEPEQEAAAIVRHGNERVVRARFNDARFFYSVDQKVRLTERVDLLNSIVFHKDLGSYAQKSERVRALSHTLALLAEQRGFAVDLPSLDTAACLAKTDLTCELVKEFTELQGVVGGLYARAQGHGEAVAAAIYDQYLPQSAEDRVPFTAEGLLLSLADKADSIGAMFGLGLQPTGSKDPFALRRAANGIVKMLAASQLPLTLSEIATAASAGRPQLRDEVLSFFHERLEFYLRDAQATAYDVVKAVLAAGADDPRDAVARAKAVSAARHGEDFAAIAAAFKRMRNILEQARGKGENIAFDGTESLAEPSERKLAEESARLASTVDGLRRAGEYEQALAAIATLRPTVDAFFDSVMVMAPEPQLRQARLGLLHRVLRDFSSIADFSEIVIAG